MGGTPRWPGNQRGADGAPASAWRDTLPDSETGSLVINIKIRVPRWGELKGQWHPYVYQLVLALQQMRWRCIPKLTKKGAGDPRRLRVTTKLLFRR